MNSKIKSNSNLTYKICTKCVMDTSDPDISFDDKGVCIHCSNFENNQKNNWFRGEEGETRTANLVEEIKKEGVGKEYDCIIGLSGGVDSAYLAYWGWQYGLRMLAVHVDAGWNTEMAVKNIENICKKLKIDLITEVIDWDDMRAIQKAFFKSKVVNQDIPQDHAFFAALYKYSTKNNIRYVLNGYNISSESALPLAWRGNNAMDVVHLKAIYKKYGDKKISSYPFLQVWKMRLFYRIFHNLKIVSPLNLMDYNKNVALETLKKEVDFIDYGGKHHESVLTRFQQSYFLPTVYGYEKRRAHLASLIMSGQMAREEALKELEKPLYSSEVEKNNDIEYFIKKIGLSRSEFNQIMSTPPDSHDNFPNQDRFNEKLDSISAFFRKIIR
ncbi:MAG: N-acetyl sugar amidotransferase [Saprospiraceae bacterium]|nr:N-acetyl sugar amidotransferase [Saprospiraceae bacterium]